MLPSPRSLRLEFPDPLKPSMALRFLTKTSNQIRLTEPTWEKGSGRSCGSFSVGLADKRFQRAAVNKQTSREAVQMHPHAVHNWLHCYRSVCGCGRVQNNVHVRQQAPYAMSCNSPCSSSSHKNCVLQNTAKDCTEGCVSYLPNTGLLDQCKGHQ